MVICHILEESLILAISTLVYKTGSDSNGSSGITHSMTTCCFFANHVYVCYTGVELRLRNVLISVAVASDEEGFGERLTESACSYSQGTQARVKLHLCYEAMDGRYVRITAVEANEILNLFEVEIFG